MQVLRSEEARKYNDMHEICFRKKLLVCNFIMIQKLVVGRFFYFEKVSRFYAVKGGPSLDSNNHCNPDHYLELIIKVKHQDHVARTEA